MLRIIVFTFLTGQPEGNSSFDEEDSDLDQRRNCANNKEVSIIRGNNCKPISIEILKDRDSIEVYERQESEIVHTHKSAYITVENEG